MELSCYRLGLILFCFFQTSLFCSNFIAANSQFNLFKGGLNSNKELTHSELELNLIDCNTNNLTISKATNLVSIKSNHANWFLRNFNYYFNSNKIIHSSPDALSIACQNIHVSLNEFCEDTVTLDAILADVYVDYSVFKLALTYYGTPVPNPITKDYLGKVIMATVTDTTTGNSCWSSILVEDKFAPIITCENDTMSCVKFATSVLDTPLVHDNCNVYSVKLIEESFVKIDCDPNYIKRVYRTWVAFDPNLTVREQDTCVQEILLERVKLDSIVFPLNDTVYCNDLHAGDLDPLITGVPRLSNCSLYPSDFLCYVNVDFEDADLGEINCVHKVLRTWTVLEFNCNVRLSRTMPQFITVLDTAGPIIINSIPDLTLSTNRYTCFANFDLPKIQVEDECHDLHRIDIIYPGGILVNQNGASLQLAVGLDTIIYRAYDKCYNVSSDTIIITVEDKSAPVAICEGKVIVSLPLSGHALAAASVFDDGSFDDCGSVTLQVRRMDLNACGIIGEDDWGSDVEFCCADAGREIMIASLVTDHSGNTSICMSVALIQDKTGPAIICPPNITVDCRLAIDTNHLEGFGVIALKEVDRKPIIIDPIYSPKFDGHAIDGLSDDNCPVLIDQDLDNKFNQCGIGVLSRIFTSYDIAGNSNTCTQTITTINDHPLHIADVDWPDDFDTSNICNPLLLIPELLRNPLTKEPITKDDVCTAYGISYTDKIFAPTVQDDPCFKIFRIWKILDWCNRNPDGTIPIVADTQIIKVNNLIAPRIRNCRDTSFCDFELNCAPIPVIVPLFVTDDCTDSADLFYTYRIDLFSNNTFDIIKTNIGNNKLSETLPIGKHTVQWTVEDRCGNLSNCIDTLRIRNCKSPSAYCLAGLVVSIIAVDTNGDGIKDKELDTLYARELDAGTSPNCGSSIRFSFTSNVNDTVRVYTCDSLGRRNISLWVRDDFGNTSRCNTFIDVQDNNTDTLCRRRFTGATIYGIVRTVQSDLIENAKIDLIYNNPEAIKTDVNGLFRFEDKPLGDDYELQPSREDDWLNGVTTADIVKIQKHILGTDELSSPYQLIAADVNDSKTISARDIADLRKLILGVTSTLPTPSSWKFVDANFVFPQLEEVLNENWNRPCSIINLNHDVEFNLIGVKMGDVNVSAKTKQFGSPNLKTRNSESLVLNLENKIYKKDDIIELPFSFANISLFEAFQTTLMFNFNKAEFIDILEPNDAHFNISNFSLSHIHENKIPISWNGVFEDNKVLFILKLRMKEDANINEIIMINSSITASEAYTKTNLFPANLELRYLKEEKSAFEVYQNQPNPWAVATSIKYNIPSKEKVIIKITNPEGKLVFQKEVLQDPGNYELQLNRKYIPQAGIYYIQIDYKDQSIIKTMVVTEY